MGPAQDDVGGHLADDFRLVHMVGQAIVAGPSVRDDAGTGGGDRDDEGLERGAGKSAIGARRMRRGLPSGESSTAPATSILPCELRP